MATIQISLSEQEKQEAEILFKNLGMTTSGAIKVFLNQSIQAQGLPFTPKMRDKSDEKSSELTKSVTKFLQNLN